MTSNPDTPADKPGAAHGRKPGTDTTTTPRVSHAEARQKRLEEQLRANLKKRKDQVRQRAARPHSESEDEK